MRSELSSGAKELVQAGRAARVEARLSVADRQRILEGLRGRLGDAIIPDVCATSGGTWAFRSVFWKGLAVLCGVGAVAFLGSRGAEDNVPPAPAALAGPASIEPAAPAEVQPPEPEPEPQAEPQVEPSLPAASALPVAREPQPRNRESRSRDRLAEEVALLSRAEADLHRGQAAQALRSLDEHQRKFPDGALSVERRAARARALCALGRGGEAKADLARLSRVAPGSPLEARAREACGPAAVGAQRAR